MAIAPKSREGVISATRTPKLKTQRYHRFAKSTSREPERVFAGIEQMGSKFLRTIGQARANFVMTMMATCYNMKRLAYFDRVGLTAF